MAEAAPTAWLTAVALLALRIGAMLRPLPLLGGHPLPLAPLAALAVALAACLAAPVAGPALPLTVGALVGAALAEVVLGTALGYLARLAFAVLDLLGGLGHAAVGDAGRPLELLTTLLGTTAFLLVGGHHTLFAGLAATTRCFPPGSAFALSGPFPALAATALGLFGAAMATAVLLACPLLFAGLFAELGIGLIGRIAPALATAQLERTGRAMVVQLLVLALLGVGLSEALRFLEAALVEAPFCGPPHP